MSGGIDGGKGLHHVVESVTKHDIERLYRICECVEQMVNCWHGKEWLDLLGIMDAHAELHRLL